MQSIITSAANSLQALPSTVSSLSQSLQGLTDGPLDPIQLSECVKTEATKVGLMCGSPESLPSESELQALLLSLQQTVTSLCLSLHALTGDAGPSFKHDLDQLIKACAEKNGNLVQSILTPGAVIRAVANVWDTCGAIKAPLNNKSALFKRMGGSLRAINDTLREMAEIEQQPVESIQEGGSDSEEEGSEGPDVSGQQRPDLATNGHAATQGNGNGCSRAAADEYEGSGSSICDYDAGPLSAMDRDIVSLGSALMCVAADTLKMLSRQLLLGSDGLVGAPLEAWENCIWHAKNLQNSIEDLGAAMYPPQGMDEIEDATEGLVLSVQCMLEEVPQEHMEATAEAVLGLQASLERAEQRMRAAIVTSRNNPQ